MTPFATLIAIAFAAILAIGLIVFAVAAALSWARRIDREFIGEITQEEVHERR